MGGLERWSQRRKGAFHHHRTQLIDALIESYEGLKFRVP